MTSMMQGVMDWGYGYAVRQRGFTAPAAGKTGTSHDGWFAAYTSNLLCVVWVGFDDYSDLKISGALAAAPIWAEFMKRAQKVPAYSDMEEFKQPDGVIDVRLDKATNRLSTPNCPDAYSVAFIAGTEPQETCDQTEHKSVFQKIFGAFSPGKPAPPQSPASLHPVAKSQSHTQMPPGQPAQQAQKTDNQTAQNDQNDDKKKKKGGFFSKIVGIFKGDDDNSKSQ